MSIIADCHMHTSFSGDSEAPMEDMIERSIALGLKEITITEHMDYDFIYTEDEEDGFFEVDTDAYRAKYLECHEKYADRIRVNFGIELGMQMHINEKNSAYAKSFPFDFIIGSSHLCNKKDPYLPSFWEGRDEKEGWHEYFESIKDIVSSYDDFDTYGHLDYVLRYGPTRNKNFNLDEFRDDIDKILKTLIEKGKGIEANTSGYHYKMGGPHPCAGILKRYRELGGEILTIGSDAHKPEAVAAGFEDVRNLLLECGFERYCIFHERKPEFHRL